MRVAGAELGFNGTLSIDEFNAIAPNGASIVEDKGTLGRADASDVVELGPNAAVDLVKRAVTTMQGLAGNGRPQRAPGPAASPAVARDYILREYPGLFSQWDTDGDNKVSRSEYCVSVESWSEIGQKLAERVRPADLVALERAVVSLVEEGLYSCAWLPLDNGGALNQVTEAIRANPGYKGALAAYGIPSRP